MSRAIHVCDTVSNSQHMRCKFGTSRYGALVTNVLDSPSSPFGIDAQDPNNFVAALLDTRQLAEALGVKPSTIRSMRSRGQLPEPVTTMNGGPVWHQGQIEGLAVKDDFKRKIGDLPSADPVLPQAVDLFAGCGGLSLGFRKAAFGVVAGFDNWDPALDIYNKNLDHPAFKLDLGDVQASIQRLKPYMEDVDLIVGGPPCQDFSSAGKRVEADRADLTEKFAEIVCALAPTTFVMENVERAQSARAFRNAVTTLSRAGYGITEVVLDAAFCGVPQKRKRLFTIGMLGERDGFLLPLLESRQSAKPMTLRDYFGDRLGLDNYYRHPRSYARRGVFSVDEPSPTIRGVNRPIPPGYPGHPGDAVPVDSGVRPLTTAERAQIQTFPEGFYFGRSKTAAEQMIGNAVPVELSAFVARALADYMRAGRSNESPEF